MLLENVPLEITSGQRWMLGVLCLLDWDEAEREGFRAGFHDT